MIAANAPTLFTRLLAGAITLSFFTYAFVNMGMVSGILPVVGVPLPFISYGGTALVTLFLGLGILMSISHPPRCWSRSEIAAASPARLPALLLAACGSSRRKRGCCGRPRAKRADFARRRPRSRPPSLKKGGGFYKDDGPGDDIPDGLDDIPDAEPKWEPLHKPATKPYVVLGKEYVPEQPRVKPYKVRGIASWYGKKFHGQKTSIGEPYDMFAMTAAHPTLALPSYVRVTGVQSGKIGDRPHHRPWPLPCRPRHRSFLHRCLQAGPDQRRQRPGRSRGDHSRRNARHVVCTGHAAGPSWRLPNGMKSRRW